MRALTVLLALACAQASIAAGFVETYFVNAQYRGAVKKGFQDLGDGQVAYQALDAGGFRVQARGRVRNPDDGRVYAFRISETYELAGATIRSVAIERRELNEHAKPHEDKITEVLPFAYLVRVLAPPSGDGDPSRAFRFRGREYVLRYRQTERHIEAELYRGDATVGKFFLLRGGGAVMGLDKFRIPIPEEHLVVSFIVKESQRVR